jgi:uncharacterized protein (DUF362 family)
MKKKEFSRREFLKVGAGAAAGLMTVSFLGCSGGTGGGGVLPDTSDNLVWYYHGMRGITALYQPTDSSLYRQLLPAAFQMPDSLQVVVTIVSYYDVTKPLVAYREGFVMLSCKYKGQTGLYTLTMPVTDKTANDAGISIGFPKYIADRIDLTSSNGVWSGEVIHQGRRVMQMTFTAQAEMTTSGRTNPGPSCVNLVPPGVGPKIQTVSIIGKQLVNTTTGTASVVADPGEPWAKLLEGADLVAAQLDEITGDWTLVSGNELNTAVVSIARIKNGRTDLAVEEAIALLGGIGAVTSGKEKIMLKPNLVSDNSAATTNPAVIRTLAQLMQTAGKQVSIGEGSAACNNFNVLHNVYYRTKDQAILDGMQQHIFDTLGYTALAQSLGIPLINLHSGEMVSVPVTNGYVFNDISLHRSLVDIDMLCSVPMMKTHNLGGVSLGMKNLFGTFPGSAYGSVRSLVHDQAAGLENSGVAAAVVDLVRANKVGLVVIDASNAMEGNGPFSGSLVRMDLIIAGTNPLATDMVAANIMGFQSAEIPTFQWANKAGMQPRALNQIEIRGESIASVQRKFLRPQIVPWSSVRDTFGAQEI